MVGLRSLQLAAENPALACAALATRISSRSPRLAKSLMRASRALDRNDAERVMRLGDIALIDNDLTGALRALREAIALQPTVSAIYGLGARIARSTFAESALADAVEATIEDDTLREMILGLLQSPKQFHASRFWLYFMLYNAYQIEVGGLDNFKRTANNNYFTWTSHAHVGEQIAALAKLTGRHGTLVGQTPDGWDDARWARYLEFLAALYAYAQTKDDLGVLVRVEEPLLGTPLPAMADRRLVSQDLCHTAIELNSILGSVGLSPNDEFTVYELGAGHGRIGYALLSLFPRARYVVIDIPPALHVSQWYLSKLLRPERVFRFRSFETYDEVARELEASRAAFLLPHQGALLPDKSADVFVNICSIQEMTHAHVALWFGQIDRLCRGHFYTKQYLRHVNDIDGIVVGRSDYPVRPHWTATFDRQCEAFPSLFEALYRVGERSLRTEAAQDQFD
jgi:putative sugar O-methyltransferase